jgi:hypothetical protein
MDEDEEDDEDVGTKLSRIRAAQLRVCGQDSDDTSEDEDAGTDRLLVLEPTSNLSQVHALSQQGFTQDLSQAISEQYCQQPSPVEQQRALLLASTPVELAEVHEAWSHVAAMRAPPNPTLEGADYLTDPFSPFAPGGFMATRQRPPLAPSRAPSPTVRSASPATSTQSATKGKKKPVVKKKTPEEKMEEDHLQRDIDTVVNNFKPEYREYIVCEEERDAKNLEDKEYYSVARWLKVNKPTPRRLDLSLFSSKQIRKLATVCGVRGGGTLSLFQARRKIAQVINMGTVYNDDTIANPKTTASERKVNTLMRITNACFHADMKDKFIDLNDSKKRANYEASHGGNPVKDFWVHVSELTNDSSRNGVLGVVLEAEEGEDVRLRG